jgi:hypothetical protein
LQRTDLGATQIAKPLWRSHARRLCAGFFGFFSFSICDQQSRRNDVRDELSKLGDGKVLPRSDVEEFGPGIVFQNKDASVGKIVDSENTVAETLN